MRMQRGLHPLYANEETSVDERDRNLEQYPVTLNFLGGARQRENTIIGILGGIIL